MSKKNKERSSVSRLSSRQSKPLIAVVTLMAFITTTIWTPGVSFAMTSLPAPEVSLPYQATLDSTFKFFIPKDLGKIESLDLGQGPGIVHIQTAHGHYDAQQKIRGILHHLDKNYGIHTVLVEGSAFKLRPEILNVFPQDPKSTMKVADQLAKHALVKGPELYLLDKIGATGTVDRSAQSAEAYGIEDARIYRENGEAFVQVLTQKQKAEQFLRDMDEGITRLSAPHLSDALRRFIRTQESFEKRLMSVDAWLSYLKDESQKNLLLDLNHPANQVECPMMVRLFKIKELQKNLDLQQFEKEREKFLKAIKRFIPEEGRAAENDASSMAKDALAPAARQESVRPVSFLTQIGELLQLDRMGQQLPDPETSLLFESMVRRLPTNFNYQLYPNVRYFIGILLLTSELKADRLMDESSKIAELITSRLARTDSEKAIVALLKDYRLLQKLFALELLPEDYETILASAEAVRLPHKNGQNGLNPSSIVLRLESLAGQTPGAGRAGKVQFSHLDELNGLFDSAMQFYSGVKARDLAMLDMVEKRLKETGVGKVAVVTGGFHARPFRDYFASQGYTYALVTPKITGQDESGHRHYIENTLQMTQTGAERASNNQVTNREASHSAFQARTSTRETVSLMHTPQELRAMGADPAALARMEYRVALSAVADNPHAAQVLAQKLKNRAEVRLAKKVVDVVSKQVGSSQRTLENINRAKTFDELSIDVQNAFWEVFQNTNLIPDEVRLDDWYAQNRDDVIRALDDVALNLGAHVLSEPLTKTGATPELWKSVQESISALRQEQVQLEEERSMIWKRHEGLQADPLGKVTARLVAIETSLQKVLSTLRARYLQLRRLSGSYSTEDGESRAVVQSWSEIDLAQYKYLESEMLISLFKDFSGKEFQKWVQSAEHLLQTGQSMNETERKIAIYIFQGFYLINGDDKTDLARAALASRSESRADRPLSRIEKERLQREKDLNDIFINIAVKFIVSAILGVVIYFCYLSNAQSIAEKEAGMIPVEPAPIVVNQPGPRSELRGDFDTHQGTLSLSELNSLILAEIKGLPEPERGFTDVVWRRFYENYNNQGITSLEMDRLAPELIVAILESQEVLRRVEVDAMLAGFVALLGVMSFVFSLSLPDGPGMWILPAGSLLGFFAGFFRLAGSVCRKLPQYEHFDAGYDGLLQAFVAVHGRLFQEKISPNEASQRRSEIRRVGQSNERMGDVSLARGEARNDGEQGDKVEAAGVMPRVDPSKTVSWQELNAHALEIKERSMRAMTAEDTERFQRMSQWLGNDLFVDFSKQLANPTTIKLLLQLANETRLRESIDLMFAGAKINETEGRAVLHVALRNIRKNPETGKVEAVSPIYVDGKDVMPDVLRVLNQIKDFSEKIRSGEWRGYTGERITDIVSIGIGGSDLGPRMGAVALEEYAQAGLNVHYVSNVDPTDLGRVLKKINAKTAMFIVSSKSWTTQETAMNAETARKWFLGQEGATESDIAKHFVAVSTNAEGVAKFGIDTQNMFEFWDWVGGRYSVWSAVGLSLATYIGFDNFVEMLEGAREADEHFRTASFDKNIPVLMALFRIWYRNFFKLQTHGIVTYSTALREFYRHMQQVDMESLGKSRDRSGKRVEYDTGDIIIGGAGTDVQHSYFQNLHQGTTVVPTDFISLIHNPYETENGQHAVLLQNFMAQTTAMMQGKNRQEAISELTAKGWSGEKIERLLPFELYEGNRPTTSILLTELTPRTLGKLLAIYEHNIFSQGAILNIYAFDQPGVQLGKLLANGLKGFAQSGFNAAALDLSTQGLVNTIRGILSRSEARIESLSELSKQIRERVTGLQAEVFQLEAERDFLETYVEGFSPKEMEAKEKRRLEIEKSLGEIRPFLRVLYERSREIREIQASQALDPSQKVRNWEDVHLKDYEYFADETLVSLLQDFSGQDFQEWVESLEHLLESGKSMNEIERKISIYVYEGFYLANGDDRDDLARVALASRSELRAGKTASTQEQAEAVIRDSALALSMDPVLLEQIIKHERLIHVTIPVQMDDGSVRNFHGFRVQHNSARGPYKGGIRMSDQHDEEGTLEEARGLSTWMSVKTAVVGIPLGGGKGDILASRGSLSETEQARLIRGYVRTIMEQEGIDVFGPFSDIPAPDMNTDGKMMAWFADEYIKIMAEQKKVFDKRILTSLRKFIGSMKEVDPVKVDVLREYIRLTQDETISGYRFDTLELATVTGKPAGKSPEGDSMIFPVDSADPYLGGSQGRVKATGQGGFFALERVLHHQGKPSVKGVSYALQGFGNVAGFFARIANRSGMIAKAIQSAYPAGKDETGKTRFVQFAIYNEDGIDIAALDQWISDESKRLGKKPGEFSLESFPGARVIANEDFWKLDVDVMVPAATNNVITEKNAGLIKSPVILELANGPTSVEGDKMLLSRGKLVIPDVLANAGGVIVSYFEMIQNYTHDRWTTAMVDRMLSERMSQATDDAMRIMNSYRKTFRQAVYMSALMKIADAQIARDPELIARYADGTIQPYDSQGLSRRPETTNHLNLLTRNGGLATLLSETAREFNAEIAARVDRISGRFSKGIARNPVVLITGPESAGKAVVAESIVKELQRREDFKKSGRKVHFVDYDHVKPEEFEQLLSGQRAQLLQPRHTFYGAPVWTPITVNRGDIIVMEGRTAFSVANLKSKDQGAELYFGREDVYKIFINVSPSFNLTVSKQDQVFVPKGMPLTSFHLRFIREILDRQNRRGETMTGAGIVGLLEGWHGLKEMQNRTVYPQWPAADETINMYFPEEIAIIRNQALRLMILALKHAQKELPDSPMLIRQLESMIAFLREVNPIHPEELPEDHPVRQWAINRQDATRDGFLGSRRGRQDGSARSSRAEVRMFADTETLVSQVDEIAGELQKGDFRAAITALNMLNLIWPGAANIRTHQRIVQLRDALSQKAARSENRSVDGEDETIDGEGRWRRIFELAFYAGSLLMTVSVPLLLFTYAVGHWADQMEGFTAVPFFLTIGGATVILMGIGAGIFNGLLFVGKIFFGFSLFDETRLQDTDGSHQVAPKPETVDSESPVSKKRSEARSASFLTETVVSDRDPQVFRQDEPWDLKRVINPSMLTLIREFYYGIIPERVREGIETGLNTAGQALRAMMEAVGVSPVGATELSDAGRKKIFQRVLGILGVPKLSVEATDVFVLGSELLKRLQENDGRGLVAFREALRGSLIAVVTDPETLASINQILEKAGLEPYLPTQELKNRLPKGAVVRAVLLAGETLSDEDNRLLRIAERNIIRMTQGMLERFMLAMEQIATAMMGEKAVGRSA